MDTIFVPITCLVCRRHSALSLSKSEIKQKLDSGEAIELHCAYDDVKWDATSRERVQMMKLSVENDVVNRALLKHPRIQPQGLTPN
jgi:hypothetical protein